MTENYQKNSLLGQLEKSGIINDEKNSIPQEGGAIGAGEDFLPFGILTSGIETSPFNTNAIEEKEQKETKIVQKRLNDLDLNIFQETGFIDINDDELSVNEKIKKIKSLIKKIEDKIFMLEDSDDEMLLDKLKNEKEALIEALKLLEKDEIQNPISQNANATINKIENKIHIKEKLRKLEKFILKFCPLLHKSLMVRHALNKLVMLNESAKELMTKKIPYGESEIRYNDFTAYLSCANVIHAKLTKKM